jgi:hypothetical protein
MVFGRRKDGPPQDEAQEDDVPEAPDSEEEAAIPPIPSAAGPAEPSEESGPDETASSWSPLDTAAAGSVPDEPDEQEPPEVAPESDLPAWGVRPFADQESPQVAEADASALWGTGVGEEEPTTFSPAVLDSSSGTAEHLGWLQPGPVETEPWGVPDAGAAPDQPSKAGGFEFAPTDLEEVDEIAAEAPAEEMPGGEPEGLDSFSEMVTTSDERWAAPSPVIEEVAVEETVIYQVPEPVVRVEPGALSTRSFPLPEGEIVFRNLRTGFTDPARLLRHLAGEGHTGVLHVQGTDGGDSYVVLVDGYVVAVASAHQGIITTSNRIAFPNFPNSQDTINVVSYSRHIARGLGFLLHAPVRFAGLGAMFVNLEGLRSYLSKYSCSGGMIIHAHEGVGVALFEEGKLLGGYAGTQAPTADLGQLRDLVKDLEAEIDVRFGGPAELAPIPLDTLLAGYPL